MPDGQGMWTVEGLPDHGVGFESRANTTSFNYWWGDEEICYAVAGYLYDERDLKIPQLWVLDSGLMWVRTELPLPPGGVEGEALDFAQSDLDGIFLSGYYETPEGYSAAVYWSSMDGVMWEVHHVTGLPEFMQSRGAAFVAPPPGLEITEPGLSGATAAHMVGTSFNMEGDGRATIWQVDGPASIPYDLNDLIVGETCITLEIARNAFRLPSGEMVIMGWGPCPGAPQGGADGPHAYVLIEDANVSAPGPSPIQRVQLSASPNPAGTSSFISYALPAKSPVRLTLHDVVGRRVATFVDGVQDAGSYTVPWNGCTAAGRPVAEGVYFLRLVTRDQTKSWKMAIQR
jgi:hypothetical protein